MEGKTNFFEALKTVWWHDLTHHDPRRLRQIYATGNTVTSAQKQKSQHTKRKRTKKENKLKQKKCQSRLLATITSHMSRDRFSHVSVGSAKTMAKCRKLHIIWVTCFLNRSVCLLWNLGLPATIINYQFVTITYIKLFCCPLSCSAIATLGSNSACCSLFILTWLCIIKCFIH